MIDNLDARKSETFGGIPANCLKGVSDISANFFHTVSNDEVLKDFKFLSDLKLADVVPAFKSQLLPALSQITTHINEHLSPCLCGCRKSFNTQTALSSLINKWKQIIDKKGYGVPFLVDLFKAFSAIKYELLIAELHAHGFTRESLLIILSYPSDRC